ncbi:MAG: carbohydrate kinase family protein [bacterium]
MAKKRFDFLTIGGATRDIMFNVGHDEAVKEKDLAKRGLLAFKLGAKIAVPEVHLTLGGGAANTAVALAKLGFKVATILRVGQDDDGEAMIRQLSRHKIETRFIQIDEHLPTSFSVILMPSGAIDEERQYVAFLCRSANERLFVKDRQWRSVKPKWIYLTSLPAKGWPEIMASVQMIIKKRRSKMIWNPGSRQLVQPKLMKKFLLLAEVLILNREEAMKLLAALNGRRTANTKILLKNLRQSGPKIIVVTNGAKGADAYDGKDYYHQKALPAKALDTTGVGDAFGAGFAAGLVYYHYDLAQALYLGARNSAVAISRVGAQIGLLNVNDLT